MEKTVINIKTDPVVKKQASQIAARLGLPLGTVMNNYLRQFIRERRVIFEEGLTPNKATAKRLLIAERNIAEGKNLSPIFNTPEELFKHLNSL
ncbi:MAG: type II toxin-antitoxin system RelB/DinJ family antitoxin [Patescibacteria group bacterium]